MPATARHLAQLLHEELERDGWGTIEPHLFRYVANPDAEDYDDWVPEYGVDLEAVLHRVAVRLNMEKP